MQIREIKPDFKDERGIISDIFYKTKIDHVAEIKTFDGNFIRGNHYHKESTQHIYMVNGSLRYWYKGLRPETEVKSILVPQGWLVKTEPYEVHSLEMLGPSTFIVFSSGLRGGKDYEEDTFREFVILTKEMLQGE